MDPEIFKRALQFIYTGTTELYNIRMAVELYSVAHEWLFSPLEKLCLDFIRANLNKENIWDTMEFSLTYDELKQVFTQWIDGLRDLVNEIPVEKVSKKCLVQYIKGLTKSKERPKFQLVDKWLKVHPEHTDTIREEITSIIDFDRMSTDDILYLVRPTDIVQSNTLFDIICRASQTHHFDIPYKDSVVKEYWDSEQRIKCQNYLWSVRIYVLKLKDEVGIFLMLEKTPENIKVNISGLEMRILNTHKDKDLKRTFLYLNFVEPGHGRGWGKMWTYKEFLSGGWINEGKVQVKVRFPHLISVEENIR